MRSIWKWMDLIENEERKNQHKKNNYTFTQQRQHGNTRGNDKLVHRLTQNQNIYEKCINRTYHVSFCEQLMSNTFWVESCIDLASPILRCTWKYWQLFSFYTTWNGINTYLFHSRHWHYMEVIRCRFCIELCSNQLKTIYFELNDKKVKHSKKKINATIVCRRQ